MNRDQVLPNPFAEVPVAQDEQSMADVLAAVEAELAAWLDPPPLFLADEFAERIQKGT